MDQEPEETQPAPTPAPADTDKELDEAMKEVSKDPKAVLKDLGIEDGKKAA